MKIVRRLEANDLEAIQELIKVFQVTDGVQPPKYASKGRLQNLLLDPNFYAIAVFYDEKLVGGLTAYSLAMYKEDIQKVLLYEIEVLEHYRRNGFGTYLINKLKAVALKDGATKILIPVSGTNTNAIRFYHSIQQKAQAEDIMISLSLQK